MYYQNEAIIMSRTGNTDATAAAADKAIAADPNKPLAYYLKGQALVGKSTVDKAGKIVTPRAASRPTRSISNSPPMARMLRK